MFVALDPGRVELGLIESGVQPTKAYCRGGDLTEGSGCCQGGDEER